MNMWQATSSIVHHMPGEYIAGLTQLICIILAKVAARGYVLYGDGDRKTKVKTST